MACSHKIIDPEPDNFIQYEPNDAVIVGLYIKQHKGLSLLLDAHNEGKLDAAWPLIRINYEAYIKMRYLIMEGPEAQRDYRLKSYKNRYKMYEEHSSANNPVMDVFLYKFLNDIKNDGFTTDDFASVKFWAQFGGKKLDALMKIFEPEDIYRPGYGLESDSVHSDWGDIRQLHLEPSDGRYVVKIEPKKYHGRGILSCIYLHLQSTAAFLEWYKTDFGAEILFAEDLVSELKRVSELLMEHFVDIYENRPDIFVER